MKHNNLFFSGALFAVLLAGAPAGAARLEAQVIDQNGAPVADAIVYALPLGGNVATRPKREAAISQLNKEFVPLVTAVQTGTAINFPNHDTFRHHVYSFSPAKTFEIKLYSGVPAQPVVFDAPGEIILGCNIHDTMLAYIYVVDTPYFAKTGKLGKLQINALPAGEYEVKLLHYGAANPVAPQKIKVETNTHLSLKFLVGLKPQTRREKSKEQDKPSY